MINLLKWTRSGSSSSGESKTLDFKISKIILEYDGDHELIIAQSARNDGEIVGNCNLDSLKKS